MAVFENCRAEKNLSGGFYTNSPFTKVIGGTSVGNAGYGFVDDSANGTFETTMAALLASGAKISDVDEIRSSVGTIVQSETKENALSAYERFSALAASHVTILEPLWGSVKRLLEAKGWLPSGL